MNKKSTTGACTTRYVIKSFITMLLLQTPNPLQVLKNDKQVPMQGKRDVLGRIVVLLLLWAHAVFLVDLMN